MASPKPGATPCSSPGDGAKLHSLVCATRGAVDGAATLAPSGTHWANIAMGVGGLATVAALLVSLYLLRQQMRNQRQADQDRYRDHASNISFWLTLRRANANPDDLYESPEPGVAVDVHIVNASPRPAMSVLVLVGIRGDVWRDASAKDKTEYQSSVAEWKVVAIAPHNTKDFQRTITVPKSVAEIVADYKDAALIGELSFTDSAGVGWVKTHTGELIERSSAEWVNSIPLSLTERAAARSATAQRKESRVRRLVRWLGNSLIQISDR